MKITFLGTGGVHPTKERNTSSIHINHNNENILIDCGEGTQRQMQLGDLKLTKITKILISHWHGDHVLGLPGLLTTIGLLEYSKVLEIYGPRGTKRFIRSMFKFFVPNNRIRFKVREIKKSGVFLATKDLIFSCTNLNHVVPCLGYVIKEKDRRKINLGYLKKFGLTKHPLLGQLQKGKSVVYKGKKILVKDATKLVKGKKISIILDTAFSQNIVKAVKDSDLLIIESTYLSDIKEKAREHKHLTSQEAARIAKLGRVKKLVLTHISKRYKDDKILLKEAKKIFKNTIVAHDLMTFNVY